MEPDMKPTWELTGGEGWTLTLPTLTLSVEPIELSWSALVEVPNGGESIEYFATKEEAQRFCEETAKTLLRKDLKSLGGGGHNIVSGITTGPFQRTRIETVGVTIQNDDGSEITIEVELEIESRVVSVGMPAQPAPSAPGSRTYTTEPKPPEAMPAERRGREVMKASSCFRGPAAPRADEPTATKGGFT